MVLDILTVAQEETYANIETKYFVYIPDNSNISKVLADMHIEIKAMSDSSNSLSDWISSWFSGNG